MFHWYSQFKDLDGLNYQVDIYPLAVNGNGDVELKLADDPVIITVESSGLFTPIKSQSCTVNIRTDGGLFDLYTVDPQSVIVAVTCLSTSKVLFRGYATPCQYGQDWTTIDTLSLECVEMLSSLKSIPYSCLNYGGGYVEVDSLISYLISKIEAPSQDTLYHTLRWYWPKWNFSKANTFTFQSTSDFLHAIKLNESNFFDDDEEKTPWSCYEVLEEICKFFNVSLVPYEGAYYFIDYQSIASTTGINANANFWEYSLDLDIESESLSKSITVNSQDYSGGTSEVAMDDVYNKISVNANRYDINELVVGVYNENNHDSLTLKYDFGGSGQTYTESHENFWGTTIVDSSVTTFKTYCTLKPSTGWTHRYWKQPTYNAVVSGVTVPMLGTGNPTEFYNDDPHAEILENFSQYKSLPENKYINTISATLLHYAQLDEKSGSKPTKLDWKDVIMFNCMTDTIKPSSTSTQGLCKVQDIYDRIYEKPVLEYNSPDTLNYSPKDGTSWIVINNKLWYQQNKPDYHDTYPSATGNVQVKVTNYTSPQKQLMFPIEGCTSAPPYMARQYYYTNQSSSAQYSLGTSGFEGWEMLRMKLQIGDKYWNGSSWTTTDSTFYLKYSGEAKDVSNSNNKTFSYLSWMSIQNNTTYQDKVGTDGYAIPITSSDGVVGKLKLTIYTPRLLPHGTWEYSYIADEDLLWWDRGPVVFMKDFSVDYVYTDNSAWWLNQQSDTRDIKYTNDSSKDRYKYENTIECKINSWQEGHPIAKSFPIVNFQYNQDTVCEFLETISDGSDHDYPQAQEMNIVQRQLRHYKAPMKTFKCHRKSMLAPWKRVLMNDALELDGTYVVDSQEFNVRNRNATITLVEYGDSTIYT